MTYEPDATFQYAPANTQAASVTKPKINAKTVFVFSVKMKKVHRAKPHTMRYSAIAALNSTEAAPSAALPVGEYAAARPSVGSCRSPNDSQKTANSDMTIIGKKFPIIHSNIVARVSRSGPTKKKIPATP